MMSPIQSIYHMNVQTDIFQQQYLQAGMIKNNCKSNEKHPLSSQWPQSQKMTANCPSFFGKGITCIDKIDAVPDVTLRHIKQLDLSHNALMKLENLKQFPNLQVINLAHNHIADGKQIAKLGRLKRLKTVLVKGNPFMKSEQGRIQAFKHLIIYDTDVQVLTTKIQLKLHEGVRNYCQKIMRDQYLHHMAVQIQLITDYNIKIPEICSGDVYHRIIHKVLQHHILNMCKDNRKYFIYDVLWSSDSELSTIDSVEQLQQMFEKYLSVFNQQMQQQMASQEKAIQNKIEVLEHVKSIRKQKLQRQRYASNFKRLKKLIQNQNNVSHKITISRKQLLPLQQFQIHGNCNKIPQQIRESSPQKRRETKNSQEEKFQNMYYNMMNKYNPVYQLLYSPLHSLKSKQKDLLIQTLSNHLKQKSFALFKNQKVRQQNLQLKCKLEEREKVLRISEQKYLQYKMVMGERVEKLQHINRQNSQEIQQMADSFDKVNMENKKLTERVKYIQQQLSQVRLKQIKVSNKLQRVEKYDDYFQAISSNHLMNTKKQFMLKLNKKAQLWYRFVQIRQNLKAKQEQNLKSIGLFAFKQQYRLNKSKVCLKEYIVNNKLKKHGLKLLTQSKILLAQKKLTKFVSVCAFGNLMQFLKIHTKKRKLMVNNILKVKQINHHAHKLNIFKLWKERVDQKVYDQKFANAELFFKQKIISKSFKNWNIFLKLPIYQQAELRVDLKTNKIFKFLSLLSLNRFSNQQQCQKFLKLIVFLNQSTRVCSFRKFRGAINFQQQLRRSKGARLSKNLKLKYFLQLIRTSSALRSIRLQKQHKVVQILNIRRKQLIEKLNSQANARQMRRKKLMRVIDSYRKNMIAYSFRESLKQFMIQDKLSKKSIKSFFVNLNSSRLQKLVIKSKVSELRLLLNSNKKIILSQFMLKKQFITELMKPKTQKKQIIQYLDQKYFKLMLSYFKNWRIQVFRNQIDQLKNKIRQFGPQIEQISNRQKTTFEEKLVLMNIIDNKQKTIKGFIQQLQQAEYTIRTKQDKYQKLKQYFYETQDVTVLGSQVVPVLEAKIPERDFNTFASGDQRNSYFSSFRRF